MAKVFDPSTQLKPHTKVRSLVDLPRVPKYTDGKVQLANGMSWIRYWVQFDNGEVVGHISHGDIVPVKFWDQHLVLERQAEINAVDAEARAAAAAESGDKTGAGADGAAAAGVDPVINGVTIPQLLIERSAAARVRLGAPAA
ncbi:MAG: hypothetical protein V3V01_17720 [Acidimicrobiales bacterium]